LRREALRIHFKAAILPAVWSASGAEVMATILGGPPDRRLQLRTTWLLRVHESTAEGDPRLFIIATSCRQPIHEQQAYPDLASGALSPGRSFTKPPAFMSAAWVMGAFSGARK